MTPGVLISAALCLALSSTDAWHAEAEADTTIVDNRRAMADVPDLRLTPAPIARLAGQPDGTPLWDVRHARVLSSGGVLIALGASTVYEFDADGRFVRVIAGTGDGPGQLRVLASVTEVGRDTLALHDSRLRRITVLAPSRSIVRTYSDVPAGHCCIGTGIYLAAMANQASNATVSTSAWPQFRPLVLGGRAETLAEHLPVVRIGLPPRAPRLITGASAQQGGFFSFGASAPMPFHADPMIAFSDAEVLSATGRTFEYHATKSDGMTRLVRWSAVQARAVSREDVRLASESLRRNANSAADGAALAAELARAQLPRTHPVMDRLLAEPDGSAWARIRVSGDGPETWVRFDPQGLVDGVLRAPAGLRVLHAREGRVAGLVMDAATGFEEVLVYGIVR
jgi:propanediol dehydratase small subunit